MTLNYALPLDKLPITDWLGADYRYQVSYNWRAGPRNQPDALKIPGELPDSLDFKNTIQNSREQNLTGRADLVKLYNKIEFLKKLNTPKPAVTTRPGTNQRVPARPQPQADTVREIPGLVKGFFRILMSVRSINGTYTLAEGTVLPGFTPNPKFLGMDEDWKAPGWPFILGSQDPDIRKDAAANGWLTTNKSLTMPFSQLRNESINLRANVEPTADLKIQFDVKKETTDSYQEMFRYVGDDPDFPERDQYGFASLNPNRGGSYRISFLSIKTAFDKSNDEIASNVFHDFEDNLPVIQNRFRVINNNAEYDTTSQDVVIPAFLAAYSGQDANTISLSPFPKTPMPNWRVDFTGLNKLGNLRNVFQSITISHGYQSQFSVMNYSNSLEFTDTRALEIDRPIEDYNRKYFGSNVDDKLLPVYVISQVLISEQFSPLIGINLRTKNRLTANLQYKTKRDLSLNISNAQITELSSKDLSFEFGFTKNNMRLPFKSEGRLIVLKNDLTIRMNVTMSDTRTIQRKVNELNIVTNGNINFQLRPNISYVVNQKLNLQLYYEQTVNEPQVSNAYRRSTNRFGLQVRFSLAQ
jgi:cell surface protein SprA